MCEEGSRITAIVWMYLNEKKNTYEGFINLN
jgi:hypothetical protein